jgi:NAD(P)-dependent dehydrogenase (short-subunit alcohol dehydrogenase family)
LAHGASLRKYNFDFPDYTGQRQTFKIKGRGRLMPGTFPDGPEVQILTVRKVHLTSGRTVQDWRSMDLQLANKLALVSGSTKGIGRAIATGLAREGARVIINGRADKSVSDAAAIIRKTVPNAKLESFPGDLSRATIAEKLVKQFPDVEILINNLGIFEPRPFEQIPDEGWRRFFEVNVLSGVRLSRAYLPGMKQRNWGRIIFISSESGIQIPAEMIHYGTTKTAQLALARGIAETCAGTGVTVNAVLPGPTHSDGVDEFVKQLSGGKPFGEFEKEFFKSVRPTSLIKRFATTEEVANLVVYVASPLSSATNGAALRVDGGVVRACF